MNKKSTIDNVSALVTHDWIVNAAADYFDHTDTLTKEDTIAVRASFMSDTMRHRFKPAANENLETDCKRYLKMVCGRLIKEKIATHVPDEGSDDDSSKRPPL